MQWQCSGSAETGFPPSLKPNSSFPPANGADNTFKLWKKVIGFKGRRCCTRAKQFFIIPRFQVCAQGAAEKNQRKACSFSWRGSVCRIRAYLDMAEMGFLNKGPGEASPAPLPPVPTLQKVSRFAAYLPAE